MAAESVDSEALAIPSPPKVGFETRPYGEVEASLGCRSVLRGEVGVHLAGDKPHATRVSQPLDSGGRRSDESGCYPGCWSGTCFHSNRSSRLRLAHQGMKSRSCGLVQRISTADSATPHPDPSGGQAPRLAKSSTALHFLIPPSTNGLQFGTFRPWRAGIEVDRRAHR